jgi:uncharacterized protein (DUF2132 family)
VNSLILKEIALSYEHDSQPDNYFMKPKSHKNTLEGITLEQMVKSLQQHYGWEALANQINIKCFKFEPTVKSSLSFLRKTDWAREKVERLYQKTTFKNVPQAEAISAAENSDKPVDPWAAHRKKD